MESIKFMTVDMAKALSERLVHSPKTKQVMDKIYIAALNGRKEVFLSNNFLPTEEIKSNIVIFFLGLGYNVQSLNHGVTIRW